jgi:hypothetical protein
MVIIRSLKDISNLSGAGKQTVIQAAALLLHKSDDLVCNNMFCEKVATPCICRVERALARLCPQHLKVVDLSNNNLTELPPSLQKFTLLEELNLSHNTLKIVPQYVYDFKHMKKLNI